jgi:energy-coupling factor transporter ATP-binding protein EcfA2
VKEQGIISPERTEELEGIHSAMSRLEKDLHTAIQKQDAMQASGLADICAKLASLSLKVERGLETRSQEERILKRLRFSSMFSRSEDIAEAGFSTFDWMLKAEEPQDDDSTKHQQQVMRQRASQSFSSWIETGNQIYHISGKAGSGKSTLMKFLYNHTRPPRSSKAIDDGDDPDKEGQALYTKLTRWAGNKKLVLASFFFWNSGDPAQRSLRGLYQSILFEILRQCPELIKEAFIGQFEKTQENIFKSEDEPFRISELKEAISIVLGNTSFPDHRFCFFIDGLDEFEADLQTDHWDLARMLRRWAMSPDVKICVSSRPHEEFLQCFNPELRLQLHEMTRVDVENYVYGVINGEDPELTKDEKFANIVRSVIDGADGVFLWVCIVTRSLVDGIRRQYSVEALMRRLSTIPRNIEQLFDNIFDDIDPGDRERSDKMLMLSVFNHSPPAIMFSWVDDLDDPDFPFNTPIVAYTDEEIQARHERVRRQLDSLSKGLLEMRTSSSGDDSRYPKTNEDIYFQKQVSFLHRTVKDYLNDPKRLHVIQERLGDQFDVLQSTQRLRLAMFKFARTMPSYFKAQGYMQTKLVATFAQLTTEVSFEYSSRFLEECEKVLEHHRITPFTYPGETEENTQIIGWSQGIVLGQPNCTPVNENISYHMWLVSEADKNMHVTNWLLSNSCDAATNGGRSLLFEAARCYQLALMRRLLERGISPECSIIARRGFKPRGFNESTGIDIEGASSHVTTVWESFLFVMAAGFISEPANSSRDSIRYLALALFLEFGANCNAYFVLKEKHPPESTRPTSGNGLASNAEEPSSTSTEQLMSKKEEKLFKLSLEELILLGHPPNLDVLMRHVIRGKGSLLVRGTMQAVEIMGTALSSWSGVRQSQSATYAPLQADSLKSIQGKYTVESVHVGSKCLEKELLIKCF